MIYFNIQQPQAQAQPTDSHLALVRRNLAIALDKNARLTTIIGRQAERIAELTEERNELQESLDSKGMGMWELVAMKDRAIGEYAQIVAELKAEKEELIAENVRLTGQVHALLSTIEAQL